MTGNPLRVCLLVNDSTIAHWQANALSLLFEETNAELGAVVYNEYEEERSRLDLVKRAIELREWTLVAVLHRLFGRDTPQSEPVELDDVLELDGVNEYYVEPDIVDGWQQRIPEDSVEKVAAECDVAIRFGFGFLVGPILEAFEYGVLSYHHGDLRKYRGQPMGFWEFVNGEEEAGVTVQRLNEKLDAGEIAALKQINIDDLHTWHSIRCRLLRESDDMLVRAFNEIEAGETYTPEREGSLYTIPKGVPVLEYAIRNTIGYINEI